MDQGLPPTAVSSAPAAPIAIPTAHFYSKMVARAALNDDYSAAEHYIKVGGLCTYKDKMGQTPIHYVVCTGSEPLLELLLEEGAIADEQDNLGDTALHLAIMKKRKEVVRILIKYGASCDLPNRHGDTARDLAREYSCEEWLDPSSKSEESHGSTLSGGTDFSPQP